MTEYRISFLLQFIHSASLVSPRQLALHEIALLIGETDSSVRAREKLC